MARAHKRNGKWSIRYRHRGRGAQPRVTFATKREADAAARAIDDARGWGRDWEPARASARAVLLEEMMVAYTQHSERTRSTRTAQNRIEELDLFLRWLVAREGRVDVGPELLSRRCLELYDQHLQARGHRKPNEVSSRRIRIGLVYGFWRWAAEQEEWDGLVPMPRRIDLPDPLMASVHAPTWAEVDQAIGRLGDEMQRRAAVLMRMLGLRVWQVCRLEWADFDFARGAVTIRPELGKTRREKLGRVLPMPPALRDELAGWGQRREGRVIRRSVSAVRRALRAAWAETGIARAYWSRRPAHAIRKTFRSELRALRCESDAIEYWCGRRTGGQTDDYTDPRSLALRQIADAIPPLAPCAQGVPLLRLLCWPDRMDAA